MPPAEPPLERRGPAPSPRRSSLSVRAAVALHFAQRMGRPLALVAAYTVCASLVVRWDMHRVGEASKSLGDVLYAMYTQLFFEPTEPLPAAPYARALFWLTPLVGTVLVAEGLLKVGASLLNPEARREVWVRMTIDRMEGHVVVCGLGHVGYRVVQELHRAGVGVVGIERSAEGFVEAVRQLGVPVLVGDARRDELLVQAGVERARAVVCATNDDLVNLEVALDSKRMSPTVRVVLRMFDQRLATKVGGALELDETFSTSALSAPLVALQATTEGVRGVYRLSDGTTRVTAELVLEGREARRVVDLEEACRGRVVAVKGRALSVGPSAEVEPGEVVVLDVPEGELERARGVLGAGRRKRRG